jgi:hypothetical protein
MRKITPIIILGFLLTSCANYYIPLESFKQQFAKIDSTKLENLSIRGPLNEQYNYLANQVSDIECFDKYGKPFRLKNSPSIEIRFTHGYKNRRTVFYFDRISVNRNSVTGVKSRFMDFIKETIPLDSVTKIEIQDGRKGFKTTK